MSWNMVRCAVAALAGMGLANPAVAQESLDKGKSPAQLFASDCSPCHKSPQGLAKSGGLFGLDSFLREHYTASRETATAIANYLKSMDSGPSGSGRAAKRSAKGDDRAKSEAKKKPAAKADEAKGGDKASEKKPDAAGEEPRPPAGILAPEKKSGDAKTGAAAAGEPKPAGDGKKSD
ncbi:MAG TPA: hypothetical protein VFB29_03595 [Pseudolabrys sp.]|nr:hypothetical protein [Pseudolabrys sp.]